MPGSRSQALLISKKKVISIAGVIAFPEVVEQPAMWGYQRDLHQTDKHKALVNPDSGKLFSIVSKDYKLIRHEAAIDQVEEAITANPDLGRYRVITELYNGGGGCGKGSFSMKYRYRFNEGIWSIQSFSC